MFREAEEEEEKEEQEDLQRQGGRGTDDLRHGDDHEIQPVPGVSQERETVYSETPSHDLGEGLEGVDTREGVPGERADS